MRLSYRLIGREPPTPISLPLEAATHSASPPEKTPLIESIKSARDTGTLSLIAGLENLAIGPLLEDTVGPSRSVIHDL